LVSLWAQVSSDWYMVPSCSLGTGILRKKNDGRAEQIWTILIPWENMSWSLCLLTSASPVPGHCSRGVLEDQSNTKNSSTLGFLNSENHLQTDQTWRILRC
jgi:hypothetical protein